MARLFIRHEPVDWEVIPSQTHKNKFHVSAKALIEHGISRDNYAMDWQYVCIVHENVCWAARNFATYSQGANVRIDCSVFGHTSTGKLLLLKDTLLG